MSTVTLAPDGSTTERAVPLPRRFRLTLPQAEAALEAAGAPVPWRQQGAGAVPGALQDPSGALIPEAARALAVLGAPQVAVDADLAVRTSAGDERLHSWQRWYDGHVTALSTALHDSVELGWWRHEHWQAELARLVSVTRPAHAPEPPARELTLPYDLLLGGGAALRDRRPDVFEELVSREADAVRVGGEPAGRAGAAEQVRLLELSAIGRLQVVVAGAPGGRRTTGWLSWLLFADGWRALVPYDDGARAMVRVSARHPLDLGVEVARLVAEVRP